MPSSSKALSPAEISARLEKIPKWGRQDGTLVRILEFPSYLDGLEFVTRLGQEAERMDHHPMIVLDFKKVTVRYSTHSAGGITELDFRAADFVEKLYRELSVPGKN